MLKHFKLVETIARVKFSLDQDGFEIRESILGSTVIEELRRVVGKLPVRHRGGARNLLHDSPAISELAGVGPVKAIAESVLGADCFPVRGLFFDKPPTANWKVPWHQDLTIAVAGRIETPGFTGWSVKDGVPHVQPQAEILERMVTLRLQLDDCDPDNGPLRVLPGSHRHGRLSATEISQWRQTTPEFICCGAAGSVLVINPLLLHASSRARLPSHRRVIHIEYANCCLPGGLRWHDGESRRNLAH